MISFQHLTANQTYVQSINYFSRTCSKLRSTPKSYLHTYLSRESFIRHLEYWFHHLLLVGCKHKHELIKRAHQYRSTNISWIVKQWKFFIKYSTMSQRHRPCVGADIEFCKKKSRRKAYNSCLSHIVTSILHYRLSKRWDLKCSTVNAAAAVIITHLWNR